MEQDLETKKLNIARVTKREMNNKQKQSIGLAVMKFHDLNTRE
jgi:hypothetical protein